MTTPRTEAGRAYVDRVAPTAKADARPADRKAMEGRRALTGEAVSAIEDEAARKERERIADDLRARITTNLNVYQRRIDNGTGTDFDRGKAAAFRVVIGMLEDRPPEPAFACGRAAITDTGEEAAP